jgi:hypothetical protein
VKTLRGEETEETQLACDRCNADRLPSGTYGSRADAVHDRRTEAVKACDQGHEGQTGGTLHRHAGEASRARGERARAGRWVGAWEPSGLGDGEGAMAAVADGNRPASGHRGYEL